MLKKLPVFVLFIIIIASVRAQGDSSLIERLHKPITDCEVVATNCQKMVVKYSITECDSFLRILDIWEKYCQYVEPVERVKILADIFKKQYSDSVYEEYIKYEIKNYEDRIKASADTGYFGIYEQYKDYFNYVPLNGKFDKWTSGIASNLLREQSPGSSEYLLCLLLSGKTKAFDSIISAKKQPNDFIRETLNNKVYTDWNTGFIFKITSGMWFPLGKLAGKFKSSARFDFDASIPVRENIRVEFNTGIGILLNKEEISIHVEDSVFDVKSHFCWTLGLRLTKEFRLGRKIYFDYSPGIGVGLMDTDLKKPEKNSDGSNEFYSLATVDIVFGVAFRTVILKKKSIGLNFEYHYSPFNFDKKLEKDIGNQYLTAGLLYRF